MEDFTGRHGMAQGKVFPINRIWAELNLQPVSGLSSTPPQEPKRRMRKQTPTRRKAPDMWVSPRLALRGPDGDRAFIPGGNLAPASGARFLELADIALGFKYPKKRS